MQSAAVAEKRGAFEVFKCYGPRHSRDGRILVEVDWERRMIHKKCDDCGKWHTLISQEERV